jgi:hypothetical protein
MVHALPFLAIPPTVDYFKRDYYVNYFPEEKKQLGRAKSVVNSIVDEKKQQITVEHMLRFFTHLQLDRPIENSRQFLPINHD